jgi:hypothetical protein
MEIQLPVKARSRDRTGSTVWTLYTLYGDLLARPRDPMFIATPLAETQATPILATALHVVPS